MRSVRRSASRCWRRWPLPVGELTTPTGAATGFSGGFLAAAGIAVGLAVIALLAMPAQRATGQARLHMH